MKKVRMRQNAGMGIIFLACLFLFAMPSLAWATSVHTPQFNESNDSNVRSMGKNSVFLFGDMLSAGQEITINGKEIASNCIAAGQSVKVSGGKIGADAIIAASSVNLDSVEIGNNVFAAANTINCSASAAGAITAVGRSVNVRGQASVANLSGESVFIDGAFDGDVNVTGENVTIGPNTAINGKLTVQSGRAPSVDPGAHIASYEFVQSTDRGDSAVAGLLAFLLLARVFFAITGIVGGIVFVILLLALGTDRPFVKAGEALRKDPARTLLSGLVVMIVVPIGVCVLFAIAIGWRIAIAILLACGVLSMVAVAFSAMSIGFIVFKNMNRWGAAALMMLIFGIVGAIPIVGIFLSLFCDMYVAGFVFTSYVDWRKGRSIQNMA